MSCTSEEERLDLGYSVILKYYRDKISFIHSDLYSVFVECTIIYNDNIYEPEKIYGKMDLSSNKDIANQFIEIFRINKVSPTSMEDVYIDLIMKYGMLGLYI